MSAENRERTKSQRGSRQPVDDVDSASERSRVAIDAAIISLAALAFAGSVGMLLFGDRLFREEQADGASVGRVSVSSGDVRKRSLNGVAWSQTHTGDPVFEGDSVFTGDSSKAAIDLGGGGTLNVDAKSMIVMRASGGRVELDLRYGTLQGEIAAGRTVVLNVNGQRQEISGQGAQIRVVRGERDKEARIEVVKGQVSVTKASGSKKSAAAPVVIREKEAVKLSAAKAEVKRAKTAAIELLLPAQGAKLWLPENAPVEFRWRSGAAGAKFVVEVGPDETFSEIFARAQSSDGRAKLDKIPREGQLAWRVRPADDSVIAEPAKRTFSLWVDAPPRPEAPADSESIAASPERELAKPAFAWSDRSGAVAFRLQAAKAELGFDKPAVDSTIKQKKFSGPELAPGRYVWRVRAEDPARPKAPWSDERSFLVMSSKPPAAPILKNPSLAYAIPASAPRRLTPRGAVADAVGLPAMQWLPSQGAVRYVFERSQTGRFDDARGTETDKLSWQMSETGPGLVHWRVRAIGPDGQSSQPSALGRWIVYSPAPIPKNAAPVAMEFESADEAKAAKANLELAWNPSAWASQYELELADNASFERAKRVRAARSPRAVETVEAGEYVWRVRSLDGEGLPISQWSLAKTAKLEKTVKERKVAAIAPTPEPSPEPTPAPPPPVPVEAAGQGNGPAILEPRPGTSVVALPGSSSFVNFRWRSVPGATEYKVQISRDPTFASREMETVVKRPNYFLDGSLPSGSRYWRVRAIVDGAPTDWSPPSKFSVRTPGQ